MGTIHTVQPGHHGCGSFQPEGMTHVSKGHCRGLHPPNEQMPGALSSQDYLVVVPHVSFEDTSPSLIRELNVDITRERLLFPASLYGFGNTP